jgi:predicted  nucleic acid-binding Zn-ribbon protein
MSEVAERLLEVGDLDTTITQLQHKRAGLADKTGLTALESELLNLNAQAAAATARRAELVAVQKDLESQIATLNERRASIEQRMYAATGSSTRDLQAMSEEVRHLSQRRAELEEHELVAMVDQEPIDAELAVLEDKRAPLDTQAVQLRAEVAQSAVEIDAQLAAATTARAAAAAQLPSALADRYETLRQRLKGVGVARLIGHHCDGCHLELSSVEVERIRHQSADDVVTCEQCGRILVPT